MFFLLFARPSIMKNSGKKEEDPVENPDQSSDSSSPDIEDKGKLFHWVDAGAKMVIALVGILVTIIGYNYQRSFTTSQLLVQQEKGDTEIRAQMFSKITDRLIKPADEQGIESLVQDVLLAQMLALNFHELIELKPLMIDLDEQLSNKIEKIKKTNDDNPDLEIMKNARGSLRSVARLIRDRQVASLINSPRPEKDAVISEAGSIKYISILRKGKKSENRCFFGEKDGENACLGEVVVFPGFKEGRAMYLSLDSADWKKEKFVVSLNCGKVTPEIVLPDGMEAKEVDECREGLTEGEIAQTSIAPGHKSFEVSWFDFPFTDNTLQADGNRYAVFIDRVCKDANAKPEDEPNAVRLGLLYFPKDYYPSRERPVSYKQLNDKLGLSWRETNSK
jgi:hypothetical protein